MAREVACLELYPGKHRSNMIRKEEAVGRGKKRLEAMETRLDICSYETVREH